MSDMNGLTPRQVDLLHIVKDYQLAHDGVSPTYHEIAEAMAVTKVTVFGMIGQLRDKCVLQVTPHKSRSIQLLIDVEPSGAFRERIKAGAMTALTMFISENVARFDAADAVADRVLDVLGGER